MKKIAWVIETLSLLLLILGGTVFAQETSPSDNAGFLFPIMRPDPVTLQKWKEDYEKAPEAKIDLAIQSYLLEAESQGVITFGKLRTRKHSGSRTTIVATHGSMVKAPVMHS
ncbi:MAG: hypothetical protein HXY44_04615 [Syntrophaceae bacterium]|nr:hypothetical protein [Syntrophaceae bacterium]